MEAFLAAYMTLATLPPVEDGRVAASILHAPLAIRADRSGCNTAWGREYQAGEKLDLGAISLQCQHVRTWVNGADRGTSMRWVVSVR